MEDRKRGLTGSALKWIAIVTMLIDHIGAVVLTRMLVNYSCSSSLLMNGIGYNTLYDIMRVTRTIGRLAFPIFCFLLVEGFLRTRNVYKYMLRMALFALVSEIPFDLALTGRPFYWGYQNVMLTLLIGILTMWGCSLVEKRFAENKTIQIIGCAVIVAVGMALAYFLRTDYAEKGVLCIMVLYFFRKNKLWQMLAGALSLLWEPFAMLAFLLINQYNGQRGMKMKYFFYLFYPLHLFLLYLLCVLLEIQKISVI